MFSTLQVVGIPPPCKDVQFAPLDVTRVLSYGLFDADVFSLKCSNSFRALRVNLVVESTEAQPPKTARTPGHGMRALNSAQPREQASTLPKGSGEQARIRSPGERCTSVKVSPPKEGIQTHWAARHLGGRPG